VDKAHIYSECAIQWRLKQQQSNPPIIIVLPTTLLNSVYQEMHQTFHEAILSGWEILLTKSSLDRQQNIFYQFIAKIPSDLSNQISQTLPDWQLKFWKHLPATFADSISNPQKIFLDKQLPIISKQATDFINRFQSPTEECILAGIIRGINAIHKLNIEGDDATVIRKMRLFVTTTPKSITDNIRYKYYTIFSHLLGSQRTPLTSKEYENINDDQVQKLIKLDFNNIFIVKTSKDLNSITENCICITSAKQVVNIKKLSNPIIINNEIKQ